MINWYCEVISPADGDTWAMLAIQPQRQAHYDQLAPRLRRAGCTFLSTREYVGVMWATTSCTVTVQNLEGGPHLTEMHTGASRLMPTHVLGLPPMFAEATERGRLLLALLRPDTLMTYGSEAPMPAEQREHAGEVIEAAVGRREVLAGFARVLDQPAPRAGNLNRRVM